MKHRTVRLTPQLAAEWKPRLSPRQRKLSESHADFLAGEMTAGRWSNDGSPIRFDKSGRLIDGHHRVEAVIRSGITIEVCVVEDLPEEAFETIDTGKARSLADAVYCSGTHAHFKDTSALLRLIDRWDDKSGLASTKGRGQRVSSRKIVELLGQHEASVKESVSYVCGNHDRRRLAPPSVTTFCHWLFSRIDPEIANRFIDDVASGADLPKGDGRYLLSRQLQNRARSSSGDAQRSLVGAFIKAWNLYREGKQGSLIAWRPHEAFPIPH